MKKEEDNYIGYEKVMFRLKFDKLIKSGFDIKEIVKLTGFSEETVRRKKRQIENPQLSTVDKD